MSSSTPPAGLKTILAASDLSEDSDKGLQAAAALAGAAGASLHVVHCVQPPVFPYWEGDVSGEVYAGWEKSARTDLEWQVQRVLGEAPNLAGLQVRVGEPAHAIAQAADQIGASLVVVGPHQPRALFDDLLGTIADRLVRLTSVPCLIANKPVQPPLLQVLFPVDFSPPSQHCVETGMGLLASGLLAYGGQSPADPSSVLEFLFVSAFAAAQPRPFAVEPRLAAAVDAARDRLPPGSNAKLLPRILSAPLPVEGIKKTAERMDADLIVLGTHGYGMLGRALLGSVASAVARRLPFSILLVPPPA
jgi:nucleotide-binding universal stress UspA family protein